MDLSPITKRKIEQQADAPTSSNSSLQQVNDFQSEFSVDQFFRSGPTHSLGPSDSMNSGHPASSHTASHHVNGTNNTTNNNNNNNHNNTTNSNTAHARTENHNTVKLEVSEDEDPNEFQKNFPTPNPLMSENYNNYYYNNHPDPAMHYQQHMTYAMQHPDLYQQQHSPKINSNFVLPNSTLIAPPYEHQTASQKPFPFQPHNSEPFRPQNPNTYSMTPPCEGISTDPYSSQDFNPMSPPHSHSSPPQVSISQNISGLQSSNETHKLYTLQRAKSNSFSSYHDHLKTRSFNTVSSYNSGSESPFTEGFQGLHLDEQYPANDPPPPPSNHRSARELPHLESSVIPQPSKRKLKNSLPRCFHHWKQKRGCNCPDEKLMNQWTPETLKEYEAIKKKRGDVKERNAVKSPDPGHHSLPHSCPKLQPSQKTQLAKALKSDTTTPETVFQMCYEFLKSHQNH